MATVYKIHPAIGIARIGNSPDDFFIGPERLGEEPTPAGGFKDAQCRVKRQAARFHIFAHHDDGTVEEITKAEADITWSVHLVNKKAANPLRGNTESAADLTIDPGARSLNGANQRKVFDTGVIKFSSSPVTAVPLGEVRTDTQNRLLVLGGFGKSSSPPGTGIGDFWVNDDWYDDVSDGPVSATIKIRADNSTPPVVGAWVIATPPKFAPHNQNVITLYDRILQAMIDGSRVPAPTVTSYTKDVYPILQRARDTQWVKNVSGSHGWTMDPVTTDVLRNAIFSRLTSPGAGSTDMPDLNESTPDGRLTPTQYAHMQRWKDNNYVNDWAGIPAVEANISPDGLDRSALQACVGGAFFPGIEAGGRSSGERPIIDNANYLEAFRLDPAVVNPGDITYTMALPWQADFYACGSNWWPVPRPNDVIPQGTSSYQFWDRDVTSYQDMVDKWHTLGFVVRQGAQHVEVERCDTPTITLLTPLLNFLNVPQGPMGMVRETALAITFEVISPSMAVTLEYAPGGAPNHPQLVAFNTSVTVGPTSGTSTVMARLWVIYRTSSPGDVMPTQTVTVRQQGTTIPLWTITIIGNTVARKTTAAAFVLDRSGSMSEDRGDGLSKHVSLQQAANIFIDLMLAGDGVGIVRFNEDAQVLQNVLQLGDGTLSDINRGTSHDIINGNGLDPLGSTSIGDGIFEGRGILNSTSSPYDQKSLIVLTDGVENMPRWISDVADQINEQTYAVGLGMPQNISAAALQTISGNNGGYLLITGAIGTDNRFLLQKYFLQILAGISNAEVVLDPEGQLIPNMVQRIPFQLTDGDAGVDVILLTPYPQSVDFRLQTPSGLILEPWRARSDPSMRFIISDGLAYYRLVLPTELQPNRFDQGGTWHALLSIGKPRLESTPGAVGGIDRSILHRAAPTTGGQHVSQRVQMQRERTTMLSSHSALASPAVVVGTEGTSRAMRTLPYSLVVHSYSNISLAASTEQTSFEPGARVSIFVTLAQSGVPMKRGTQVWVDIQRPGGGAMMLPLNEDNDSQFSGQFTAGTAGLYSLHVRARGRTPQGEIFTRERLLTVAVWRGGDSDPAGGRPGRDFTAYLCSLLTCLTSRGGVISAELEKRLFEAGFDLEKLRKCLGSCTKIESTQRR